MSHSLPCDLCQEVHTTRLYYDSASPHADDSIRSCIGCVLENYATYKQMPKLVADPTYLRNFERTNS